MLSLIKNAREIHFNNTPIFKFIKTPSVKILVIIYLDEP